PRCRRAPCRLPPVQAPGRPAQGPDPLRRLRGGARPMKRKSHYTVACLSGDGIGPELMAEASRALAEAGRLHGFSVDEVHAPFAGEAVSRYRHRLPAETREACRQSDAVLVALTKEPALEGVKAELEFTWRVQRVRLENGDIAVVSPLDDQLEPFVVRRAFDLARS